MRLTFQPVALPKSKVRRLALKLLYRLRTKTNHAPSPITTITDRRTTGVFSFQAETSRCGVSVSALPEVTTKGSL
jgi:hypothetical protein